MLAPDRHRLTALSCIEKTSACQVRHSRRSRPSALLQAATGPSWLLLAKVSQRLRKQQGFVVKTDRLWVGWMPLLCCFGVLWLSPLKFSHCLRQHVARLACARSRPGIRAAIRARTLPSASTSG